MEHYTMQVFLESISKSSVGIILFPWLRILSPWNSLVVLPKRFPKLVLLYFLFCKYLSTFCPSLTFCKSSSYFLQVLSDFCMKKFFIEVTYRLWGLSLPFAWNHVSLLTFCKSLLPFAWEGYHCQNFTSWLFWNTWCRFGNSHGG